MPPRLSSLPLSEMGKQWKQWQILFSAPVLQEDSLPSEPPETEPHNFSVRTKNHRVDAQKMHFE